MRVRVLLGGIFLLGALGLGTELLLLSHFEQPAQLIPLALIGVGMIGLLWEAARPTPWSLRVLRTVAAAQVIGGVVGITLHYQSNVEFEREMTPDIGGIQLVREAISGAIPALAPGALVQLGLIGLAYAIRENT